MNLTKKPYKLLVLSGKYQGTEFPLSYGDFTIGSDYKCDISLKQDGIAKKHALIRVTEKGVFLQCYGNEPSIDENQTKEQETPLIADHVYGVKSIQFKLVSTDPTEKKRSTGHQTDRDDSSPLVWKKPLSGHPRFFVGGAILFIFVLVLIPNYSVPNPNPISISSLSQNIDKLNLKNYSIVRGPSQHIVVSGYSSTMEEMNEALKKLTHFNKDIQFKIFAQDALVSSCQEIITQRRIQLTIAPSTPGSIILRGIVNDDQELQSLIYHLKNDVPGIQRVINQTHNLNTLIPHLYGLLLDHNLSGKIAFQPFEDSVLAIGYLKDSEFSSWKNFKNEFEAYYKGQIHLTESFQEKPDWDKLSNFAYYLPVSGITVDKVDTISALKRHRFKNHQPTAFKGSPKSSKIRISINNRNYICDL